MNLYETLQARNLIAQCTAPEKVQALLNGSEPVKFYIGYDPTADSLHAGHLVAVMFMSHMQRAGHRPVALFGGGTALVGDPSGKTDMRKMLTREELDHNISCFKRQVAKLVDFSPGKGEIVNNADWLCGLNYIEFLREIGVHFSVNRMLAAECYKARLETGLSFFELNYMIMQAYDFLHLRRNHGVTMQLGGDDQWSNMIAGVELNRRVDQRESYALTCNLLLTSEGKKMGKTEKGALWLDPEKTTPYEFYQYWRNTADADVANCMKMLTFVPIEEIADYEKLQGSAINSAKERLAWEVTALIHGSEEADKAQAAAKSLFGGAGAGGSTPTTQVDADINIIDALTLTGLAKSKSEARRLIEQGGVLVDDAKVTNFAYTIEKAALPVMIKKGKKGYHQLVEK
ncbi:MAG: tyrosine--tRNA ligase [Oscillospiraceae bacterium]|nr:tyrosine--tRNA ligase [Oscillospiraceae bacterium]